MLQFYFLSVFLNLLIGFLLIFSEGTEEEFVEEEPVTEKDPDEDISFLDTDWRGKKIAGSKKKSTSPLGKDSFLYDGLFRLVLGVLAVFTALIKLLSAVNGVPFFGDLVPALFGFIGGAAMLLDYYKDNSTADLELPALVQVIFVELRKYVGIALVAVALLHFILPGVLFL